MVLLLRCAITTEWGRPLHRLTIEVLALVVCCWKRIARSYGTRIHNEKTFQVPERIRCSVLFHTICSPVYTFWTRYALRMALFSQMLSHKEACNLHLV